MSYTRTSLALSLAALSLGAGSAIADTLHVPAQYATIQAAIDAAQKGDEVVVAPGIYAGFGNTDLTFRGKSITVRSDKGPASCIIDCQATQQDPRRGFIFTDGEPSTAVLDGFTITNGATLPGAVLDDFNGAGILCNNFSNPTIRNCVLTNHHAGCWGGAIACTNASPTIENTIIANNTTDDDGGGIFAWLDSHPVLVNVLIADNYAVVTGGGATNFGGGTITMINCTVVNNDAGWAPGGYLWNSTLYNTIVWDDASHTRSVEGEPVVAFSNTEDLFEGDGNVSIEPQFVDASTGDYRLASGSAGIDGGSNALIAASMTTDAAGLPRYVGSFVDQGAFERQGVARSLAVRAPMPGVAGVDNTIEVGGVVPGETVFVVYGTRTGSTSVPGCPGLFVDIAQATLAGAVKSDANGFGQLVAAVPNAASGRTVFIQAASTKSCEVSNRVGHTF